MTDRRATPRESRTSSSRDSRGTPRYSRLSSAASQDSRVDSPYSERRTPDPFESSLDSPRPKTSRASTSSTNKSTPAEPKEKRNVSLGSRNEGFASDRNDSYQDRNESYQSRKDSYQDRREDIVYNSRRKDSSQSRKDSSQSRNDSYQDRTDDGVFKIRKDSSQSRTDSYKESPQRKDSSRRRTISTSQKDSPDATRAPRSPDFPPAVIRGADDPYGAPRAQSPTDPEDVFHDSHSPSERMREEGLRNYHPQDRSTRSHSGASSDEQHPTVYLQDELGDSHGAGSSFENEQDRIESGRQTGENTDHDPSSTLGDSEMVAKETKKEPDQWRGLFYCLNTRRCSWAIVLLIFATWMPLLFMVEVGEVRRNITHDTQVMIGPQSKQWLYPKIDTQVAVYFFNVSNAEDYDEDTGGKGFVPSVDQVGPYYFKIDISREKVTWNNANNTVTYATAPTFRFDRQRSVGSDLDKVVTANVPKIAIAGEIDKYSVFITNEDNSSMFEEHSVRELMWGYRPESFKTIVEMLERVNLFGVFSSTIAGIPKSFGFFEGFNGTARDILNVYTGKGDFSKFNLVHSTNYKTKLPYWSTKTANRIRGSDGSIFQPLLNKNTALSYFSTDLYRSFALEYAKPAKVKGMYTLRFVVPDSQFTNTTMADPDNLSDVIWGPVNSPSKPDSTGGGSVNSRSRRDLLADSSNSRDEPDRDTLSLELSKAVDDWLAKKQQQQQHNASDGETFLDMEEQAGSGDTDALQSVPNAYKNFALLGDPLKHAHPQGHTDGGDANTQTVVGDAADDTGRLGAPRGGLCAPKCIPAGMYSLETVLEDQKGIKVPIFVSLPHYLGADPVYFEKVDGLSPHEDAHRPYFDIDAVTGVAMRQARRFQMNVRLPGDDDLAMVPIFWVDTVVELNDKDAANIRSAHSGYVAIETIRWLMLGLTVFSWVVLIGLCAFNRCRTYKNVTDIPDPDKGRPFRAFYN